MNVETADPMPFVKCEALGNDFILVEDGGTIGTEALLAREICDRRRGIGADGLILWKPERELFQVRIFNMDGSEAECSGNGLRCLAAYLYHSGRIRRTGVTLETVSGHYTLTPRGEFFSADMGTPALSPAEIPFKTAQSLDRVVNVLLKVNGTEFRITACSTGNPHCSVFVDALDPERLKAIGPKFETHPAFPNGTNVEFIRVINRKEIEVGFWERGAGHTPASGTGSCGAVVASVLNGYTERTVNVHTAYGVLHVDWSADGSLTLTASANVVAEGRYFRSGRRS